MMLPRHPLIVYTSSLLNRTRRYVSIQSFLKVALVAGLFLVLLKCDWGPSPVEEQSLVVEAFLDTGEPLPSVTLRQTAPMGTPDDRLQDAASGGRVSLRLGGTEIPYRESTTQPGRYVPTQDTVVSPLMNWELTAHWKSESARAVGRTPMPITIEEVCVDVPPDPVEAIQVDSLRRDSLDIPADQRHIYPIDVRVRWQARPLSQEPDSTIWVRAQLLPNASAFSSQIVEFFLEPADIQQETAYTRTEDVRQWTGVYAVPVNSGTAPLPRHNLTTSLTRGDTSFASFAQTRTDPDRREPISNVQGGLGVALAVSVDSLSAVVSDSLAQQDMRQCWQPQQEP